jgi:Mg-chelatase subunit ChlD
MDTCLAQFEFQSPLRLCWLAVLLPVLCCALRSRTALPSWQRWATVACRTAAIVLLVVASADLIDRRSSEQRFVVFVTDTSDSVDGPSRQAADDFVRAAVQHQGEHRAAFLAFADLPSDVQAVPGLQTDGLETLGSDPAAALQLAVASIPGDCVPHIVLLTDGNQTAGDLGLAAAAAGVPISVVPLPPFAAPEVALSELLGPLEAAGGQSVPVEIVVQATVPTPATLELHNQDRQLVTETIELRSGENRWMYHVPLSPGARTTFTARVTAAGDTHPQNNTRRTCVRTGRPLRVLLVDAEPGEAEPFRQIMDGQGVEVALQSLQDFQPGVQTLAPYDVLILSDVAPAQLSTEQVEAIDGYVRADGGGLILVGGDATFGADVFRDSALERLAPVTAAEAVEAEQAVLAMVLVIDQSDSMKHERRMELAKVAAKQAVQVLEPHDKAGVIAFSDDVRWVAELAPCSDKPELLRRIDTLQHYGMTRMYPAVERAVLALEQTVADRRHMILLTDGIPWPGDYREIAREMAEAGITLSTVSIGQGAEQDLLVEMARIAGGRHHHCDDAADVPAILVQETQAAAGQDQQQEFSPFALRSLPGLEIQSAPNLLGFARTNPKSEAEPLLFAVAGHPLLSWWRYGDGVTVAFTADVKDRWAGRWQSWSGYGPFWSRLLRHAARHTQQRPLDVTLQTSGTAATITVAAPWDATGKRIEARRVSATVSGPAAADQELELMRVAPGRYEAGFSVQDSDQLEVDVTFAADAGQTWRAQRTLFVDCPDELQVRPLNESLLRSVAAASGGDYDPEPASVFAADGRSVQRIKTYWYFFVLAAMLVFVADVALRRLRFDHFRTRVNR